MKLIQRIRDSISFRLHKRYCKYCPICYPVDQRPCVDIKSTWSDEKIESWLDVIRNAESTNNK